jgi:PadR family transcriptional regulator PadR
MSLDEAKILNREIFLGLWKIHILHHAAEGPVVGQWMLGELRHHGYDVSPGTLYPILRRMEAYGWLRCRSEGGRVNATRKYYLTAHGRRVLIKIRNQLRELHLEIPAE